MSGLLRSLLIAGLFLAAGGAARADALSTWLDNVAVCSGKRDLSLAVVGFDGGQQVLSRTQADEVRLAIESRLQSEGRVRLAASADVVRIKTLRDSLNLQKQGEAEAQIRRAFDGDASVFFTEPARQEDKASFRLQAIAKTGDCKATSEPVEIAIRIKPGVVDVDQVMSRVVENLARAAPDLRRVDICPFAAVSGYSGCSAALGERLLLALDAESRSDDRVLRSRPLEIRKAAPGQCGAVGAEVTTRGRFDRDRDGQSWMELEFRRGGAVLAPSGRNRIPVEGLGCDPAVRPFLEHVAATAGSDRSRLALLPAASPFAKGRRLDVRIEGKAGTRLSCWVLAPDGTASVVLPVRGEEGRSVLRAGGQSYPYDFGLNDIVLDAAFENLFACFGTDAELPAALRERWLKAAPSAAEDAATLQPDEVLDLIEKLRAVPGVVEATARIVVR
ncbi:conserved exported hypothetical protein [Bosea sp. 62]|uniref:hypothetical protein n=1 Tax=unclassified Bosea (in: a-proteobacteria) TaxID=2653178 RepID=UPI0012573B1E|nr:MULTISPECIES: hypothetical protein [unclassified Bosea (in: a-proteobacteria)]CAD5254017.1 conserved exported hypothetical protein [Bosea sp. 7B]CAD5277157.1 conserved exported hypothetical protein [Bosea sp. 21B]CAD5278250.1 conserved exported hypothetical protein [Bosea sp. 46]VVT59800.1 conserved exported hypothetical protein [Bosea sp. EC-HK365B]VXB43677.1 conserved exported hypothetical protein [Bosea sp. 62]